VRREDARRRRQRGDDPNELPRRYARLINAAIAERPTGMRVHPSVPRQLQERVGAEGGYEPVAEVLFNELDVDGYFPRVRRRALGDFAPLRFVPKDKTVVLGLVSTKLGALESKDDLKRGSTMRRGSCRSSRCACRRSAASRARSTATRSRSMRSARSSAGRRDRARSMGRTMTRQLLP
jgi:hypothetical protein